MAKTISEWTSVLVLHLCIHQSLCNMSKCILETRSAILWQLHYCKLYSSHICRTTHSAIFTHLLLISFGSKCCNSQNGRSDPHHTNSLKALHCSLHSSLDLLGSCDTCLSETPPSCVITNRYVHDFVSVCNSGLTAPAKDTALNRLVTSDGRPTMIIQSYGRIF